MAKPRKHTKAEYTKAMEAAEALRLMVEAIKAIDASLTVLERRVKRLERAEVLPAQDERGRKPKRIVLEM
jgi:hypothetical protein